MNQSENQGHKAKGGFVELDLEAIEATITPSVLAQWPKDMMDFAESALIDIPLLIARIRELEAHLAMKIQVAEERGVKS